MNVAWLLPASLLYHYELWRATYGSEERRPQSFTTLPPSDLPIRPWTGVSGQPTATENGSLTDRTITVIPPSSEEELHRIVPIGMSNELPQQEVSPSNLCPTDNRATLPRRRQYKE